MTDKNRTHIDIHASSGIRIHDPSVWAVKTSHALEGVAIVIGIFDFL
jgi:hypothetical protein